MTLKELSQLYYLNWEIEVCKRKLADLEAQRGVNSVVIDGMPRRKGAVSSPVEQLAAEITDLQAIIHAKQIECLHERNRLERYILTIDDSMTRLVFELRFIDCMSWSDVADFIGEGYTAEWARQVCSRYIRQQEPEETG
jgi:hypothetical protein